MRKVMQAVSTATRAERKHAKHVVRTEARRVAKNKPNWQKGFKKAMTANRGFDKIMTLIGRGIAVQRVRNAKAGV